MDPLDIDSYLLHSNLKQLIMFTGLDSTNNAQHGVVYNSFMAKKDTQHTISYKMLTADDELFRKSVEKSTVLTNTKGILKKKWPLKYLAERPALVVCFIDLDWDHPSWQEKKTECESKINSLKYIKNLNLICMNIDCINIFLIF